MAALPDLRRCIRITLTAGRRSGISTRNFARGTNRIWHQKQTDREYYKLEIFIPESHFAELRKALQEADAGHIGNYDSCLSYSRVISTWRPLAGTDPFIGRENEISEEEELKVEVTVTGERIEETIAAVKAVHPYEEPVINVIRLYRTGI